MAPCRTGADNVGLSLAPPGYSCAFLPAWCITVRTGDVFSEAAFIDINEWMQACFIDTFYFEEFTAFFFVFLAVAEAFFNGDAIAFKCLADAVL